MNKLKSKFKSQFNQINVTSNFNEIKHQINYKNIHKINIKRTNINISRICLSSFSLILCICLICFMAIRQNDNKEFDKLYKDITNSNLKLEKVNESVRVSEDNIYINYPLAAIGCNLAEELEFTSDNWQVYKDGEIQDKNNLNLNYGANNYEIRLYKLNEVTEDYNLEITVGE